MTDVAYLRRRAKHYVVPGTRNTLCGHVIPERLRWRIRRENLRWVACQECRIQSGAKP